MKAIRIICVFILVAGFSFCAIAEEAQRVAKITDLEGVVQVEVKARKKWVPAEIGMLLGEGDSIKTKANSRAVLKLNGAGETGTIEIDNNSQMTLAELTKDEAKGVQKTLLDLAIGKVLIHVQKLNTPESRFEVQTPTSVVGVRGTQFSVEVEALD